MRNKIDYGIDLGTTNSAIARLEDGIPVIKKTETLKDTLPSCVHFNKRQNILVGDQAFNAMKNDNNQALKSFETGKTNTFIEFKRTMGTTAVYESPNMKQQFTSEQLSAEILKKLKSFIQDETISSIVITVPAKFLNPQIEATKQAAKLAGFTHIELLQEPVAAATAYGLSTKNKNGYWLVFDFGGGTFDVALVKATEGILTVKDTDGDNWLGGKNLDEAIVDQIIIPNLKQNYAIDNLMKDVNKKEILRNAVKIFAEEAKIQLSFKNSHHILSNLGDLPFDDENGMEPEIDVEITTADLEMVLSPLFQKAIDITKRLVLRNNLKTSDIDALILVGGPTYSPILQKMLRDQISVEIDTTIDPMTIVAKGAALFASTISVSEEVKEKNRDKTKLQLDLIYDATTVDLDVMINIKMQKDKTEGKIPDEVFANIARSDGGWASGKKRIGEKATLLDLHLIEGRSNSFEVQVFDNEGNRLACQPNNFNIIQGIDGLNKMQTLPYYIGLGTYFNAEDKDLFKSVKGLEKNKSLPITGVINGLKTRSTVRPGISKDIIRIPIYQGDYNADGTNPLLNDWVTDVIITGEHLPALLPEGSNVDVTIKVDHSQIMKFTAYFPLLDHTEELQIDIKNIEPPKAAQLAVELMQAKKSAQKLDALDVIEQLNLLDSQLVNEGGSADGKMKILDGLRKQLLILDPMQKEATWPAIEEELKSDFYKLEKLIVEIKGMEDELNMDLLNSSMKEIRTSVEQVILVKDIQIGKELIRKIGYLEFEIRNSVTNNGVDVEYFKIIEETFDLYHWKDVNKAKELVRQGLQLIQLGKNSGLRSILIELISLLPDDEKQKQTLS